MRINKNGFTLIELLVVVLIIGILAAIALPQYKMAVGKAKFATLKNNARVIKSAMDRHYLIHNEYTSNLSDLDIELVGSLSEDEHLIDLADGSKCYIASSSILCERQILGIRMGYSVTYKKSHHDRRGCIAYSKNSTDKPNRLCQQETGKTTMDNDASYYNTYFY